MPDVRLIAAIGVRGQLGLDGVLPWGSDIGDLPWFRKQTMGGVVILGSRTYREVGPLQGRIPFIFKRDLGPTNVIARCVDLWPGRTIWIAGGAKTYAAFAALCTRFVITRIAYDGPADTWFDPAWLMAARGGDVDWEKECLARQARIAVGMEDPGDGLGPIPSRTD
jgi:dihydrofolate reductase